MFWKCRILYDGLCWKLAIYCCRSVRSVCNSLVVFFQSSVLHQPSEKGAGSRFSQDCVSTESFSVDSFIGLKLSILNGSVKTLNQLTNKLTGLLIFFSSLKLAICSVYFKTIIDPVKKNQVKGNKIWYFREISLQNPCKIDTLSRQLCTPAAVCLCGINAHAFFFLFLFFFTSKAKLRWRWSSESCTSTSSN